MRVALACALFGLRRGEICTRSVVPRSQSGLAAVSRESIESIGGAEASVCMAVVDQVVRMGAIEGSPFRLDATVRSGQRKSVSQFPSSFPGHTCL